jgi:hypothetical protein
MPFAWRLPSAPHSESRYPAPSSVLHASRPDRQPCTGTTIHSGMRVNHFTLLSLLPPEVAPDAGAQPTNVIMRTAAHNQKVTIIKLLLCARRDRGVVILPMTFMQRVVAYHSLCRAQIS